MPDTTPISRELAKNLKPGDYALSNRQLREIYGGGILRSRITASFRREVARELHQAGLEILSDPADEPLVVRKTAPARARVSGQRWWSRPRAIGIAAVVVLLIMVGSLSSKEPDAPPAKAAVTSEQGESVAEATPTAAPVKTVADANEAVEDRDYTGALLIAAALGDDDEARVGRRISRHIAKRVRRALRGGHRRRALSLLNGSHSYPKTRELRSARASYRAAEVAARRRAELRRIARERRAEERRIARQRARELRAAKRRARREAERLRDQQDQYVPPVYQAPAPAPSGPSTENWCGKRDGDGDGIYCED